jgi:hypothetical protein
MPSTSPPVSSRSAAAILLFALSAFAQPMRAPAPPLDPALVSKADSLRRHIERTTYTDADKKELKACNREKTDFLKQARGADPEYAKTDHALREAKLAGADMNDPAVLALMERKFTFEKTFDDKYLATPKGKHCAEGELKRHKAVAAALKRHKEYQDQMRRIEAAPSSAM